MSDLDVTDKVETGSIDDESMPLLKCVCGQRHRNWTALLSIYREGHVYQCSTCQRRLYFRSSVRVFEVRDETGDA